MSHATKRGYGMHTCALHFTVVAFKVHNRMQSTQFFALSPLYFLIHFHSLACSLAHLLHRLKLPTYKGNCQLDFSLFIFLTCIIHTFKRIKNSVHCTHTLNVFVLCFDDENWISECDMCVVVWHFNSVVCHTHSTK